MVGSGGGGSPHMSRLTPCSGVDLRPSIRLVGGLLGRSPGVRGYRRVQVALG